MKLSDKRICLFEEKLSLPISIGQDKLRELALHICDPLVFRMLSQQFSWSSLLHCSPILHDDDEVVVDYCLDAVRNCDDAALAETLTNLLLDEFVSLQINVCCRFVKHKDACSMKYGPCKAE